MKIKKLMKKFIEALFILNIDAANHYNMTMTGKNIKRKEEHDEHNFCFLDLFSTRFCSLYM